MKVRVLFFSLLFLVLTSKPYGYSSQLFPLNDNHKLQTQITLSQSSTDEPVIEFTIHAYSLHPVRTPKGNAFIASVPQGTPILKKGAPDICKLTQSIIIPDDAEMCAEIVSSEFKEVANILLSPSKGTIYRNMDPASVPFSYGKEYQEEAYFPSKIVELWEPYIVRDFRGQTIVVNPLQYNPITKMLRIYTSITVRVRKTGRPGMVNVLKSARKKETISREFSAMYGRSFINYNASDYEPLSERGSLLIICYKEFMDKMKPFVAWKKLKGIHTKLVSFDDIGGTSDALEDYVKSYYDEDENFTFLLLVGDHEQVPTLRTSSGDSDPAYGYIRGNDSYPEIITGRFSGEKASHIETQVERSVSYEKKPFVGGDWYHKATGIASKEGSNPVDWKWMRDVRSDLLGYLYTDVDEFYDGSQGGEDASGNPTSSMVSEALNEGRGLFNYMGHGNTTRLATSRFDNDDVNDLTNNYKLPFAWLGACLTGNVKKNCFAEACLRATNNGEPTGFIGVLGASISHPWVPPMHGAKEMNDILVESYNDNLKRTFGGLCVNGILHMLDTQGNGGRRSADTWLIFGDPSLMVRTDTPEEMKISHAATISLGANAFDVQCDSKDALISLTVEGEIIGTAYVSNNNTTVKIDPPLNPATAKTVQITVTGYNKIPYMKDIAINSTAIIPNLLSETNLVLFKAGPQAFYFHLKKANAANVKLSIYNALGNRIYKISKNFTSGKRSALDYSLAWNYSNSNGEYVAAGIYIAILQITHSDGSVRIFKKQVGIIDM